MFPDVDVNQAAGSGNGLVPQLKKALPFSDEEWFTFEIHFDPWKILFRLCVGY